MIRQRQIPAWVALAALGLAARAPGETWDQKPKSGPSDRARMAEVLIAVPWSTLGLGSGRGETFSGRVACWQSSGSEWSVATDLKLRDGSGAPLAVPEKIRFKLSAEGDALGGGEDLDAAEIPPELRYRLLGASDFGLIPLRMLFRHKMPSGTGSRMATKTISHEKFQATYEEKFLGVETVSRTPLHAFQTRTVRTFVPSGFQLVDYTLTYERENDNTVMAAFGLRMLVHPSRQLPGGVEAPGGVFHIAVLKTHQLDWLQEASPITPTEWDARMSKWYDRLVDQLFAGVAEEAVGNPFESPSAFALRAVHVFNERSLHRLASGADPRVLAPIAPQLVDGGPNFDPARFAAARGKTEDPLQRLLLAAAAAAGGAADPEFAADARLALLSKHGDTLRAAFYLARALRDPALNPLVARATAAAARPEDAIFGLLALGAAGGEGAAAGIAPLLGHADERVRAAAFRALADIGDAGAAPKLRDPAARLGALHPETGRFEVLCTDPNQAAEGLEQVLNLAAAARSGDASRLLSALGNAFASEASAKPQAIAVANSAKEWLARTGALTAEFAPFLDGKSGEAARRVARTSGRVAVPALAARLKQAKGAAKAEPARLLGASRDPRADELLRALSDSEAEADVAAGEAGYAEYRKER